MLSEVMKKKSVAQISSKKKSVAQYVSEKHILMRLWKINCPQTCWRIYHVKARPIGFRVEIFLHYFCLLRLHNFPHSDLSWFSIVCVSYNKQINHYIKILISIPMQIHIWWFHAEMMVQSLQCTCSLSVECMITVKLT